VRNKIIQPRIIFQQEAGMGKALVIALAVGFASLIGLAVFIIQL
jgi:hypothetical protein